MTTSFHYMDNKTTFCLMPSLDNKDVDDVCLTLLEVGLNACSETQTVLTTTVVC